MANTTVRIRRSERFTKEEMSAIKKHRKQFPTEVSASLAMGIDRMVLSGVLLRGSASPAVVAKIREYLKENS